VRFQVLGGSIGGSDAGPQLPFLREEHRVFSALRAWPEYMRLLFLPLDLSADYAPGVIMPVERGITPMMSLGAVILAALVGLAVATPWRPRLGLAPAWFFITILPVSNLVFPIGVVLAERILYLPSIALSLALAFLWDAWVARPVEAAPRGRRRSALILVAGVVAAFTLLTIARNPVWKTSRTVVDSVIRDHPESYVAQYNAGVQAAQAGDTAQAIYHWELAVRMWDRDAKLLTSIGSFYLSIDRYGRAVELLRPAFALHDDLPLTVVALAVGELGVGDYEESLRVSRYGLRTFGPMPELFDVRGRAQMASGQPALAAASWRAAIRYGSDGWVQWAQLANALAATDGTAAAAAALDTAIQRAEAQEPAALPRLRRARAGLD
jgi:tetratricopeptide (TPR) repeat protein